MHIKGILTASSIFFQNDIMFEVACEPNKCDTDQLSFKAWLSRWMYASPKLAPFIGDLVNTYLSVSATAAAKAAESCSEGNDGVTCGTK